MMKGRGIKIVILSLILFIIVGVVFIVINIISDNKKEYDNKEYDNKEISYNDIDFSFRFIKLENDKKNIVYSPLSIKYALYMLNEGGVGDTKLEIEEVINNTNLSRYNNIKDTLSLANVLYIRDRYSKCIKNEYINILDDNYDAEIKIDSFSSSKNINNWIENKTFGQIKNMLSDDVIIDPSIALVLINALAIDMEWIDKFESSYGNIFYLESGEEMTATTMSNDTSSENVSYYKDDYVTALAMDLEEYDDVQMEFIAIMPEDDLYSYINEFNIDNYNNIVNNLIKASDTKNGLDIRIPKFSYDYNLDLKGDLMKMGITSVFDEYLANLSNMADTSIENLYVSNALHKANIDFSEKGVKASAVTVMIMEYTTIIEEEPIKIVINKPFMYVIRDKKNGEIWFVGTVYEPNNWEDDKDNIQY